jgi:hypothetical protein
MVATKRKSHKAIVKGQCPICGKKHTKSEHLSHGKGSFNRFPSRKSKTKKGRGMSKEKFLRVINKGRKKAGLKPIKAKR